MKDPNACLTVDSAEVLFDYVDGTLEPGQAATLKRHVAGCEACRTLIEGQQAMWAALDSWEAPEISPDFNRKMHAAVTSVDARGGRWSWIADLLTPKNLLVPAGALALMVATVVLTRMPRAPVVDQKAGMESEVNQIERTLDDLDVLSTLDAALTSEEKL